MTDIFPTSENYKLHLGDSLELLKQIPDQSIDAVVTDPPYPAIKREYGYWEEKDWHEMMDAIIFQIRRVLQPKGSAVFILQPNSEHIGKMRPWLWEFMAKWTREWGMIQDCWWWNTCAMPTTHCARHNGLMRPSVKACVWLGPPDCYRDQDKVLWTSSFENKKNDLEDKAIRRYPSGSSMRRGRCIETSIARGGSTPFNLLPMQSGSVKRKGSKHGASTPLAVCEWFCSYITSPGGLILDPFSGVGTVGLAAIKHGFRYIGIERMEEYHKEAEIILAEYTNNKSEMIFETND